MQPVSTLSGELVDDIEALCGFKFQESEVMRHLTDMRAIEVTREAARRCAEALTGTYTDEHGTYRLKARVNEETGEIKTTKSFVTTTTSAGV